MEVLTQKAVQEKDGSIKLKTAYVIGWREGGEQGGTMRLGAEGSRTRQGTPP